MAAVSSTAPAVVIQEFDQFCERKSASEACEVWLSCSSSNQISHGSHNMPRRSTQPMAWSRVRNRVGVGGLPARTSNLSTCSSRREKCP